MNITLRAVCDADDPFLCGLYASTRAAEMGLVPWSDSQKEAFLQMQFQAQKASYAKEYPSAQHSIICREGDPVGRLYLDRSHERFHILDITVSEACRNEGTGSIVLGKILQEAQEAKKPTTIYVENLNPSIRLFERLGFCVAAAKDFTVLLQRPPAASI
jgi:ribosomal protein S18 acetylase RimI-like enzyme